VAHESHSSARYSAPGSSIDRPDAHEAHAALLRTADRSGCDPSSAQSERSSDESDESNESNESNGSERSDEGCG
jgi:hypothetical protein